MSSPAPETRAAIERAAREEGIDPAFALAVADRESGFDPRARNSKTIRGMYQMMGSLRQKYGVGDSDDPYTQAKGWARFIKDARSETEQRLGRPITDSESYLSHHFGAARAARTLKMDPSMPNEAVFTPQEMSLNPHFARAGTIGNLNASVMGDIDKRTKRFGGQASSPAPAEPPTSSSGPVDLASFGEAVDAPATQPAAVAQAQPLDLSAFGTAV